jgi:hypothetical protein
MIQLHRDYLLFETSMGQIIPCSAELVAVELIGEAIDTLDPELVQQAANAVLHYFKKDLGCTTVSVGEFSRALEQALSALGLSVGSAPASNHGKPPSHDLRSIASGVERGFELSFFPRLRQEMSARLRETPKVLCFHGLRGCVKQLIGAKRWTRECQALNDQIVEYLRACFMTEAQAGSCGLVIR